MPVDVKRVFVSRIEILLDTDEQKILSAIYRDRAQFDIGSFGRFAEPKLRRVFEVRKQVAMYSYCQSADVRRDFQMRIDPMI